MVLINVVKELDINQVPSEEEWMASNMEDEEESSNGDPPRKKLRLTKEQSRLLEESFRQNHTLNPVIFRSLSLSLSHTHTHTQSQHIHIHIHTPPSQAIYCVVPHHLRWLMIACAPSYYLMYGFYFLVPYWFCRSRKSHWQCSWSYDQGKWRCGSRIVGPGIWLILSDGMKFFLCHLWHDF